MGKLSSILLGTVSGAALALFLTSDKGKQVCSQAQDFLDDLREDPEYAKEQVCEKLTEVKEQATDFVLKTKEQVESGEITCGQRTCSSQIMCSSSDRSIKKSIQ